MTQTTFTPGDKLTTADLKNTLTAKQVAAELSISTNCLALWRMKTPRKLPYLKTGGSTNSKVVYLRIHVDQYKIANLIGLEKAA